RRAPRDAPLGMNALEISNQQQPKIDLWRQAGPAHRLGREGGTLSFGEIVERLLTQQLIQSSIEWVTGRRRQFCYRDPHCRLPITFAFAHGHAGNVVREIDSVDPSSRAI